MGDTCVDRRLGGVVTARPGERTSGRDCDNNISHGGAFPKEARVMWYKLLDAEGRACNSSSHWQWPLPTKNADGSWSPGEWTPVITPVKVCECGYHLADAAHILCWRGDTLWEAEIAPGAEKIEDEGKMVVSSCRLTRQIETYTPRTLRLLACDYAEHVLPLWERVYPSDLRPRQVIETARRFVNGVATREELRFAADAAAVAAYAATEAAYAAAADAAHAAAADAADATDAAHAAAADNSIRGHEVERAWQTERLCEILGLE